MRLELLQELDYKKMAEDDLTRNQYLKEYLLLAKDDETGLIRDLLQRLHTDLAQDGMLDVLAFIAASSDGLQQQDIITLMSDEEKRWNSYAIQKMKHLCYGILVEYADGKIDFSHTSFSQVIWNNLSEQKQKEIREKLKNYLLTQEHREGFYQKNLMKYFTETQNIVGLSPYILNVAKVANEDFHEMGRMGIKRYDVGLFLFTIWDIAKNKAVKSEVIKTLLQELESGKITQEQREQFIQLMSVGFFNFMVTDQKAYYARACYSKLLDYCKQNPSEMMDCIANRIELITAYAYVFEREFEKAMKMVRDLQEVTKQRFEQNRCYEWAKLYGLILNYTGRIQFRWLEYKLKKKNWTLRDMSSQRKISDLFWDSLDSFIIAYNWQISNETYLCEGNHEWDYWENKRKCLQHLIGIKMQSIGDDEPISVNKIDLRKEIVNLLQDVNRLSLITEYNPDFIVGYIDAVHLYMELNIKQERHTEFGQVISIVQKNESYVLSLLETKESIHSYLKVYAYYQAWFRMVFLKIVTIPNHLGKQDWQELRDVLKKVDDIAKIIEPWVQQEEWYCESKKNMDEVRIRYLETKEQK